MRTGTKVTDTTSEAKRLMMIVAAIGVMISPSISRLLRRSTIGTKTQTVVSTDAVMETIISLVPRMAAACSFAPRSR